MKKINILFVYLIHGLGGENKDFVNVKVKLEGTFDKLFKDDENDREVKNIIACYCSSANSGMKSTFPLEIMFENDFKEYTKYFENNLIKTIRREKDKYNKNNDIECDIYISFSGHSLGGNVARGTITRLYRPYIKNEKNYDNFFEYIKKEYSFITNVIPCSYLSLSSPHLGSLVSEPNETSKFIKRTEKKVVKAFCNLAIGDVGKELTFQDSKVKSKASNDSIHNDKSSKYSLINCCSKESMEALSKFPNRTLTAFLRYDLQVKYCSAMGCIETPLPSILKNEKEILVKDSENDTRIVMYSGYEEGSELEYYQKELFNEKISKNFYYNNTKVVASPDIDDQIKKAIINNKEKINTVSENSSSNNKISEEDTKNYEEMEDEFLIDNDNQTEIPVALIKLFNQISYRRISLDFVVPYGLLRMLTHGLCLDVDFILARRACIKMMAKKTKLFYSHLIIADFIRTSKQTDDYSLLYLLN
ncbi:hypothetical protein BCR36DRAFT_413854 [Piromyces finnis]|uniref:DUF676 domain-containing protein n=1 Tax=Piromyces finnis TaxID=1754191 RepID=A0A1Y1V499_9FUNG|nr:hypothetical protein BCR36DRAFT_413854 [Piromyces finnis]|eukprot:ORX46908.1 hypothetical protein BCR36DRAFT_413854 [Piromyces finnis]